MLASGATATRAALQTGRVLQTRPMHRQSQRKSSPAAFRACFAYIYPVREAIRWKICCWRCHWVPAFCNLQQAVLMGASHSPALPSPPAAMLVIVATTACCQCPCIMRIGTGLLPTSRVVCYVCVVAHARARSAGGQLSLAVLHPRTLAFYSLSPVGSNYLAHARVREHALPQPAANMVVGRFGGSSDRGAQRATDG